MNSSTSIKHNPKGNGCPQSFRTLLLFLALALVWGGAWGQSNGDYRTRNSGNWNAIATWSIFDGGWRNANAADGYPGELRDAGTVQIRNNENVTLNVSPPFVMSNLHILGGNRASYVTFNGTNVLNVDGELRIFTPTNTNINRYKYVRVLAGTLNVASVTMDGSADDGRDSYIEISSGTLNVTNNISMGSSGLRTYIYYTGAGELNIGGTITGGFITSTQYGHLTNPPTSGTVNYNNTGNQTIGAYTYYNLTFSGGGAKTLAGNITVNGNFTSSEQINTASNITFNGTVSCNGGEMNATSGVVTYNAAATNIVAGTYNNLTKTGGGTSTLCGNVTVSNILSLSTGIIRLSNSDLTVSNAAAGAITGTFGPTNMIETDGDGVLTKYGTDAGLSIVYPIGSAGYYTPMSLTNGITASYSGTGSISVRAVSGSQGTGILEKYWDVSTANITSITQAYPLFTYNAAEADGSQASYVPWYNPGAIWQAPANPTAAGANPFGSTNTTELTGEWTAGSIEPIIPKIYYSLKTGAWDDPATWTFDPGGTTTQPDMDIPNTNDRVVILSGRTVYLTNNIDIAGLDINIRDGAVLDLSTYQFNNGIATLRGQGTFKLASTNYPTITSNLFVLSGGGTTEYNNAAHFTLPATQTEYNHLRISAPGVTATQLSDIDLNGNLHIKQGTYRINDNSTARRKLTIQGDVLVDNGASFTIGDGDTDGGNTSGGTAPFTNYYDLNSHRVVVYGDFTNNGTVRFTNQPHPKYVEFPNNGMATVYFMGATNNTLHCNGTTDFYNLVLDKGIDQTYRLSVYSTAYQNFRLFGRNNLGGEGGGANPNLRKALWIRTGTLELKGMTIIPSLTEADAGGDPNGDFYIPANAALHISGSEVIVLSTSDDYREVEVAYGLSGLSNIDLGILTTGGTQSFSIYGTLQVDDGYFSTRESGGIITWDQSTGNLIINGGIVDAKQFRSAGSGGGLASYSQSGGKLLLRGRFERDVPDWSISGLKDFSDGTVRLTTNPDGLGTNLGTFNINESANVFSMSGGTIRIYDVCGTAESEAFQVFSDDKNNNVTGGTIEIAPYLGTNDPATDFKIESTTSLYNLIIDRVNGSAKVSVNLHDLTVLNDLTITKGYFDASGYDVSVGGNFTIEDGTTYTPGNNTTIFNGAGSQNFEVNTATPLALKKFKVDKPAGTTLTVTGTQPLVTVQDDLTIAGGTLDDGGKTIELVPSTTLASSTVTNSGIHTGTGRIKISDDDPTVINGNGSGVFGNIELNNTVDVSLGANTTINGELTFSQDILFDISTFGVTFGADATVTNAGANRFIQSEGNTGDGGVSKVYSSSSTSFTFPVGAPSTSHATAEYTPATLSFGTNPSTFGTITVIPVGYEHPNTTVKGNSLTYFWRVKSEGFNMGSATVNHTYTYAQADVSGNEGSYIASMYENATYIWTKYATSDVDESSNTIGGGTTGLASLNYIDGEFTAGEDAPFGEPTKYYSVANGLWRNANVWSNTSGGAGGAGVPGQNDIVIIENNHTVTLDRNESCASLQIKAGSVLDISLHTGSNFARVLSSTEGNGLFRLKTNNAGLGARIQLFTFPSGDFSDFNVNQGTTEFYTTTSNGNNVYILPANVTSYGNLILSPNGLDNLSLPNNSYTNIYGDLTLNSSEFNSWTAMSWNTTRWGSGVFNPTIEKTVHIHGSLYVNGGSFVFMDDYEPQHLIVEENIEISSADGANIFILDPNVRGTWVGGNPQENTIQVGGDIINNSNTGVWYQPGLLLNSGNYYCDITFFGSGVNFLTNTEGNPTTTFRNVTIDKGDSQDDELIVDIGGTMTTPTNDWLTLLNGTFKYLHDNNLTITTTSEFTIPSTAGLYVNSPGNTVFLANYNRDDNDVYLNGKLTIIDGNVQVGNSGNDNNNDIEYSGGGGSEIDIQGGSLTVNGQIRRNLSTTSGILKYYQSGGDVTVNGRKANLDKAKLEILNPGSVFNMSGGTLTIVRGGGNGTFGDLYLRPDNSSVTGGEILFTPGGAGAQSFIFDANVPIWDLTINNNASVELLVSPLTTKNNLTIASGGSLDANINFDIPVTIKGNFDNSGDYFHRNNLTTFSGVAQQILGSSAIDFYDLTVHPLTSLTLSQDANVTNNLILSRGRLECQANTLYLQGNLTNNATYTDSNTGIVLNGTKNQQLISGTGTFGQLELNNSQGARLANNVTLQKNLLLTRGIFDINSKLLSLGENSDIVGSGFSSSKMITSDGVFSDVGISKVFNSSYNGKTYTYPLGTSGKYTPAIIEINNIGNTGSIRINNINDHHPGVIDENNVLKYFWEVESTGITNFTGSFKLNYLDDDVRVTGANTEADYIAAHLLVPGTSWSKAAPGAGTDNVDEDNDEITFNFSNSNSLTGEFTAGIDAALPNNVPEFISNDSGDWSEPGNWTRVGGDDFTLTGGPNGFIVTIDESHTIKTDQNFVSAYRLAIDGKLEVVSSTYGHNLGTVSGSGTLYLESGTFPAGRFNSFLDCANNATLEYGGTGSYNVVADLFSSVPNLYFTGTGTRVLPNKDLTICNRLLINGPDLDNSVNNKKLTIEGTFERSAGAFISGTGATAIVSFAGSSEQFIGGSLGNFTGTNAFNNFEIDNSAGLTINSGGAVEVKNNLHLTTGNIVTSSTNTLTITNTAISSVFPAGGSATSYVDGPLTKYINQGDDFKFPIGKGDVAGNKLTLSSIREGTIAWTAEFFTPNPTYSDLTAPLTYVNSKEYWTISASDGDKAKVGIDWDSQSDLTPLMTQNGISDMRIAGYNTTSSKWEELASSQTGSSSSGRVTTTTEIIIPTSGASNYTTACINVTKPRARLNPSGSVCGDAGIPVSFNGVDATNLNYTLVYNKGGVEQAPVTISSLPYTLPTDAIGTTYQLVSFSYNGGATTGVVDNEEITTYTVPTASNAGGEQSECGETSTTLAGNTPIVGEGVWSIASGTGGSFQDPTDPTTVFYGTNGTTYTLEWTISNGGCTSTDDVVIDFPLLPEKPVAFILYDDAVCQGESDVYYSVANNPSLTYIWSYNEGSGATITGSGNVIGIDYSTTATSGTVSVYTNNDCGNSAPLELPVTVNTLPVFTVTGSSENICDSDNFDLTTDFSSINTPYDIAIEMDSSPVAGSPFTNLNSDPYVYTKELLWTGPDPSNTRIFSVTVTDTNGCSTSLITPVSVKVWKTPETGPQYHIPNTHGM